MMGTGAHVLVRLRTYLAQQHKTLTPEPLVIRALIPELNAFCVEQQSITDTRTQGLKALVNNNKTLESFTTTGKAVNDAKTILATLESQINSLSIALRLARAQNDHYSANAQNSKPTAQLRVIIAELERAENELKKLSEKITPVTRAITSRYASFDEDFERQSKQSQETVFVHEFEEADKRDAKTLKSILATNAKTIGHALHDALILNESFANTFTEARNNLAAIARELRTGTPEAKPLLHGSVTIGELLLG